MVIALASNQPSAPHRCVPMWYKYYVLRPIADSFVERGAFSWSLLYFLWCFLNRLKKLSFEYSLPFGISSGYF